jgi:hypothetical protein
LSAGAHTPLFSEDEIAREVGAHRGLPYIARVE